MRPLYVIGRVAHGVVWFVLLGAPAAVVVMAVGELAANWQTNLFGACIGADCALPFALLWLLAVRRRWSLTWPLIVLSVVLSLFTMWLVGLIGLGKLIIHSVGRGSMCRGSKLGEPNVAVRPRGLVEYTSYE